MENYIEKYNNSLSRKLYETFKSSQNSDLKFSNNQIENLEISFNESYIPELRKESLHYLCPQCSNFPLIEFINITQITYKCYCKNQEKRLVNIKDLFNEEYNKDENNCLLSPILYDTMDSELINRNYNKNDNFNNEIINKEFGFKCVKHKSKINEFRYYCNKCQKHLCKICCEEHLDHMNELINFDFIDKNISNLIYEIIKPKLNYLKELQSKELSNIIDENNNKQTEKKIPSYKIQLFDNGDGKISPNDEDEAYLYFIELIKIIIRDYNESPNYFHFINIDNIYHFLVEQIKNSACFIYGTLGDYLGMSFFCNIPIYESKDKTKKLPVLVLSNEIIPQKDIIYGYTIKIKTKKNQYFDIKLDSKRKVYIDKRNEITFIEIKDETFIEKINLLEIDDEFDKNLIIQRDKFNLIMLYPQQDNNFDLAYGYIINDNNNINTNNNINKDNNNIIINDINNINNDINNNIFKHNIRFKDYSIGGPLLSKNYRVIGFNKSEDYKNKINLGSFIRPSIDNFNKILIKKENSLYLFENEGNNIYQQPKIDYKQKYILMEPIGEGIYSKVYKAKNKNENEIKAIKIINKEQIKNNIKNYNREEVYKSFINDCLKEINIMKTISNQESCDNSVKYYEHFDTDKELVIITELCDNNLLNMLKSNKFQVYQIYDFIHQINNFFKIMKDKKIIHRNIKLENILVKKEDDSIKLKVTDYGRSKNFIEFIRSNNKYKNNNEAFLVLAPEILKNEKINENDDKSDLWSLGIIIYQLCFKTFPYYPTNNKLSKHELYNIIKNDGQKYFLLTYDDQLDDLISKLLVFNPKERLNWDQYFNHSFCNDNFYELNKKCYSNNNIISGLNIELYLRQCKIDDYSLIFFSEFNFINLKDLDLSKNYIRKIDCVQYFNCPNLKKLDFSINKIENIDTISFWNFKNLKILNLCNNEIKDIKVFNHDGILKKLKLLLLSHNLFNIRENTKIIKKLKKRLSIDLLI